MCLLIYSTADCLTALTTDLSAQPDCKTFLRRIGLCSIEWLAWTVFAAVCVVGSWWRCSQEICLGWEKVPTVPFFNLWTLGWNVDRLSHGFTNYWHAPIFSPLKGTFTFSEMQPTMLVVTPVAWLTSNCQAYYVYLVGTLGANGLTTRKLLKELDVSPIAALLGGVAMLTLPFVHAQLGVVQLTTVWGPVLTLLCAVRFRRDPSRAHGCLLGLSFGVSYLACNYYGLFMGMVVPCFLPYFGRFTDRRTWLGLGCAGIVAALVTSPIVAGQLIWLRQYSEPRSIEIIDRLSAYAVDYLVTTEGHLPWSEPGRWINAKTHVGREAGNGLFLIILAIIGVGGTLRHRRSRRWGLLLLSIAGLAFFLSLGPSAKVFGWSPYAWLMEWSPGLSRIRSPFRLAVFVQIVVVIFAASGFSTLLGIGRALSCLRAGPRRLHVRRLLIFAYTFLAIGATWPTHRNWASVPDPGVHRAWINWIENETADDAVIVCVPFTAGRTTAHFAETTRWMLLGLEHGRAQIDGYSGFFTNEHRRLRQWMHNFPDEASLHVLNQAGVDYVVVRNDVSPVILYSVPVAFEDKTANIAIYRFQDLLDFFEIKDLQNR